MAIVNSQVVEAANMPSDKDSDHRRLMWIAVPPVSQTAMSPTGTIGDWAHRHSMIVDGGRPHSRLRHPRLFGPPVPRPATRDAARAQRRWFAALPATLLVRDAVSLPTALVRDTAGPRRCWPAALLVCDGGGPQRCWVAALLIRQPGWGGLWRLRLDLRVVLVGFQAEGPGDALSGGADCGWDSKPVDAAGAVWLGGGVYDLDHCQGLVAG